MLLVLLDRRQGGKRSATTLSHQPDGGIAGSASFTLYRIGTVVILDSGWFWARMWSILARGAERGNDQRVLSLTLMINDFISGPPDDAA